MAHKLKVKTVPHINADGKPSATKKDYIVRCKRRGHICTETTFTSKSAADVYVAEHWNFVNRRKKSLRKYPKTNPRTLSVVQNFQHRVDRTFRSRRKYGYITTNDKNATVRFLKTDAREGQKTAGAKSA